MDAAPDRTAFATICRGDSRRCATSRPRRGAWAISQFWQKTQWNGQPMVEIEYASEPGLHVEQGLLLDRVEAGRGHGAVRQAPQRPVAVLAHAADPRAPGPHQAPVGAHPAPDAAVGQGLGEDRGDRVGVGTVEQLHDLTPGVSRVPAGRSSAAGTRLGALLPCPRGPRRRTIPSTSEDRALARQVITRAPGSTLDTLPNRAGGPPPVEIPLPEQARLLGLARVAVAVAAGALPGASLDAALAVEPLPDRRAGAFVTLTEHGELRGCMGNLDADNPAWASVIEAARWAARGDPRFLGVEPGELAALEIDVSILGPMERLADPSGFRPGTDGIVVRRGGRRGLLLPEVANSVGCGPTDMLVACCRKAGLPGDAWCDTGTDLWVFRTHRFGGPAA